MAVKVVYSSCNKYIYFGFNELMELFSAVICLKYCRYGVKFYTIIQSINQSPKIFPHKIIVKSGKMNLLN